MVWGGAQMNLDALVRPEASEQVVEHAFPLRGGEEAGGEVTLSLSFVPTRRGQLQVTVERAEDVSYDSKTKLSVTGE
jgi:hypothetical protein